MQISQPQCVLRIGVQCDLGIGLGQSHQARSITDIDARGDDGHEVE
jgi:hypothetical protein